MATFGLYRIHVLELTTYLIIIPCYNEAQRLPSQAFIDFGKANASIHFLFVNDGSTDATETVLKDLCVQNNQFNYYNCAKNQGKAGAIREGMLHIQDPTHYEYIGYFDADLATPLTEIPYFLTEIAKRDPKPLFVMGSRLARMGAVIERKAHRHYLGRVFATAVSLVLGLPVYDTQCGAKLIHHSQIVQLFEKPLLTKWLFDVELLARMKSMIGKKKMHETVLEIPLNEWREIEGSKLKATDFLKAPWELFKIWRTNG